MSEQNKASSAINSAINKEGYDVAVVGATGAVGEAMISILEARNFPVKTSTHWQVSVQRVRASSFKASMFWCRT